MIDNRLKVAITIVLAVAGLWAATSGFAEDVGEPSGSVPETDGQDRPTLAPGPDGTVVELDPDETVIDVDDPRHPENHLTPDTPIGFVDPATGHDILCDDGKPLTQTDRELQAALDEAVARGDPENVAHPTCDDGSVPRAYLEMVAREGG